MELDSVRGYQPGDDVRAVDWGVTARRGRLHVREFVEERDLDVLLVVDRSASLHRLDESAPGRAALECTAALAHAADRSDHPVALLQVTDAVEAYLRPGLGRRHTQRVVRSLVATNPRRTGTDLPMALHAARRCTPARGLVIVVSDFVTGDSGSFEDALGRLVRRHEVVPVVVKVAGVADLPDVGVLRVRDPETGRGTLLNSGDHAARERFERSAQEAREALTRMFGRLGVWSLSLDPVAPLAPQLRRRFGGRRTRAA